MAANRVQAASPLQRLSEAVLGPAGTANLGVLAARAGTGKTACLVQVGLAELAAGRRVLHVALDSTVRDVRAWYDRLCLESTARGWIPGSEADRLERERARHIHSYLRQGVTAERLEGALEFLADVVDFVPHLVLLDGFPFERAERSDVEELTRVARARSTRLLATALTHRERPSDPETGLPAAVAPFAENLDRVVVLAPDQSGRATLRAVWAEGRAVEVDLRLAIDPTSLLVRHQ